MELSDEILGQALGFVGELLRSRGQEFHLVVCGGSALLATEMVTRTTHDVDVLASFNLDRELSVAYPLPPALAQAVQQVALELDLRPNWLNGSASLFFPDLHKLPQWFWRDVERREFSGCLRVDFISRRGLILMKTYAALNRSEPRDIEDLQALAPDPEETRSALRWVTGNIATLENRDRLPILLHALRHDELLSDFQA